MSNSAKHSLISSLSLSSVIHSLMSILKLSTGGIEENTSSGDKRSSNLFAFLISRHTSLDRYVPSCFTVSIHRRLRILFLPAALRGSFSSTPRLANQSTSTARAARTLVTSSQPPLASSQY